MALFSLLPGRTVLHRAAVKQQHSHQLDARESTGRVSLPAPFVDVPLLAEGTGGNLEAADES